MPDPAASLLSVLDALPDEQRAAVERELTATARHAAAGELAADTAHDAGNSLFAILGLVDLLLTDTEPGSKAAERLELVRQTALELRDDLRLLVDFARSEPEQVQTAGFEDAVRAALKLVRQGIGGRLELVERYPHEPLVVACGAGALRQAALHLLAAARGAAATSRPLEVEVARETPQTAVLRVRPAGAEGLGIAIARRIAADHGGSLERGPESLLLRLPLVT
jgi:signal transduction histidine kinase